eukprot:112809-Rhodomonas_salina.1
MRSDENRTHSPNSRSDENRTHSPNLTYTLGITYGMPYPCGGHQTSTDVEGRQRCETAVFSSSR